MDDDELGREELHEAVLAEIDHLRRLIREHVVAWRVYFQATGGKPEELWPTFARLAEKVGED